MPFFFAILQFSCTFSTFFPFFNIFSFLGINNGVSVEYPVNVSTGSDSSNRQLQSSYQFQESSTVHISCVNSNQSRMCSLQTIDQSNENERLSESSESGIGDENVETPNNTATGNKTLGLQWCG